MKMTATKQSKFSPFIYTVVLRPHPQALGASREATTINTIKTLDSLAPLLSKRVLDKNGEFTRRNFSLFFLYFFCPNLNLWLR